MSDHAREKALLLSEIEKWISTCEHLKADLDASRASGETLQQELNDCRVIADERLGDFTEQMALVRAAEAEVARLNGGAPEGPAASVSDSRRSLCAVVVDEAM